MTIPLIQKRQQVVFSIHIIYDQIHGCKMISSTQVSLPELLKLCTPIIDFDPKRPVKGFET